jgi:hypothetical protein
MKTVWILRLFILLGVLGGAKAEEDYHEHTAPHGGALVVFGGEFAHIELVLDSNEGKLTAYVLDGEAENPVRINQKEIELKISIESSDGQEGKRLNFPLKLRAVANVLTDETEGDTSEFAGQSDHLKGVTNFDAVVTVITIKGKEFKDVAFNFPKGNEGEK